MIDPHRGTDTNGQRIDRDLADRDFPRPGPVIRGAVAFRSSVACQPAPPSASNLSSQPSAVLMAVLRAAECGPVRGSLSAAPATAAGLSISVQERNSLWSSMPLHSKIASATGAEGMRRKAACT
ncbi:hypothetical protein [Rhodovulum sulfidophilum]|uniref:hypothetical protein n=1 Tax=Rhodovulum sulfidophilum TaxID=35806 RepID=UPI0009532098|nr:hypothetical protein [Rhodovulum sulfidophilum]MBL3553301.1 hypothetical protein [Rhodovulum sulfidophilum]OLS48941.1 hypothetical protein BV379_12070 [Rhodovulum sulfidophilum]